LQQRVAQFRRNQPAPLDTNFEAVRLRDERTHRFVSAVQALQKAGMLPVVKPRRTQQQVKLPEGANEIQKQWLGLREDARQFLRLGGCLP
jgi:hypothetical protein